MSTDADFVIHCHPTIHMKAIGITIKIEQYGHLGQYLKNNFRNIQYTWDCFRKGK